MRKTVVKVPAKINFTLDIEGVSNGFHNLKTLVAPVSVYDTIKVVKRQDDKITLSITGLQPDCCKESNNAYKTAKLIKERFNTTGVDIYIDKKIPLCGGMGGSSADIAGVIRAMQRLFGIKGYLGEVASSLGSDAEYMLNGGFALLQGRGEKITPIKTTAKFYLVLIAQPLEKAKKVCAKDCYKLYDLQEKVYPETTETAVNMLNQNDKEGFLKLLKNDLYPSAITLLPEIKSALKELKEFGPAIMTGSGATVVGVYEKAGYRNKVYKQLKKAYGINLIKAKTLK